MFEVLYNGEPIPEDVKGRCSNLFYETLEEMYPQYVDEFYDADFNAKCWMGAETESEKLEVYKLYDGNVIELSSDTVFLMTKDERKKFMECKDEENYKFIDDTIQINEVHDD